MKTKIITIATFAYMIIDFGTQALLRGSWRLRQTEPIRSDHNLRYKMDKNPSI